MVLETLYKLCCHLRAVTEQFTVNTVCACEPWVQALVLAGPHGEVLHRQPRLLGRVGATANPPEELLCCCCRRRPGPGTYSMTCWDSPRRVWRRLCTRLGPGSGCLSIHLNPSSKSPDEAFWAIARPQQPVQGRGRGLEASLFKMVSKSKPQCWLWYKA